MSRLNAKKIIWKDLNWINREYELGGKANEAELSLTFTNGSVIYLSGAKDATEIEKFRGLAICLCYIDETQSFRAYVETLVDDVLSKALFDYNGQLCLIGTPGAVPAGYFHQCAHSPEWSHHAWTMFQNPFLEKKSGKKVQELIDQDCRRKGVTLDHPSIQRECYGRWVVDPEALVFKYDSQRNDFDILPPCGKPWSYVIGVDVGFDDADAIAVIGWNESRKEVYLVEEVVTAKQGITPLANQVKALIKRYDPDRIVMDTGGLGKKIAEELQKRYELPIHAAEKHRKFEYIELLNDALRTSKFFAKRSGKFAQDTQLVEWDKDNERVDKLKVSEKYHSDITDAVLYAFRECFHWLYEEEPEKPVHGTPAWFKDQEDRMEKKALEVMVANSAQPIDESIDIPDGFIFNGKDERVEDWI